MKSGKYRIAKPIIDNENYCGFKIRHRDAYGDRYSMRDMLKRDYTKIPSNPKTVIDIGAHIGMFSLAAIRSGAEKIYAFEPEASNFEILCHNMKINGFEKRVTCVNKGVGKAGKAKLYIHPFNGGGSSTYTLDNRLDVNNYQIVDLISISDVFDNYNIRYCDVLKLDCEGSERDILNDLDEDFISKIGQISVEIHDSTLIGGIVTKFSKWYSAECMNLESRSKGNAWVFKKRE